MGLHNNQCLRPDNIHHILQLTIFVKHLQIRQQVSQYGIVITNTELMVRHRVRICHQMLRRLHSVLQMLHREYLNQEKAGITCHRASTMAPIGHKIGLVHHKLVRRRTNSIQVRHLMVEVIKLTKCQTSRHVMIKTDNSCRCHRIYRRLIKCRLI